MGFSRQEYWRGLPFPSPVDHVLSEPSTMTRPSGPLFYLGLILNSNACEQSIRNIYRLLLWSSVQFSSVQSLSRVRLFATPWTTARQASLSITNSWSSPKPMSIESVMPTNHLILCCPLLLLPSIFPSIRVFSNESALHIRWPKYWSFSFNISPSNEHPELLLIKWVGTR